MVSRPETRHRWRSRAPSFTSRHNNFRPKDDSARSAHGIPATPVAEAITPQIQALADGLQDDPVQIFNYVHDHIKFVLYFGSKKGAELTLLEKSGNDFDQSPCWSRCCGGGLQQCHRISSAGRKFLMTILTA